MTSYSIDICQDFMLHPDVEKTKYNAHTSEVDKLSWLMVGDEFMINSQYISLFHIQIEKMVVS